MSYGKIAPYRRSAFAGEGHTGSLVFDQHRQNHLHDADRAAPTAPSPKRKVDERQQFHI